MDGLIMPLVFIHGVNVRYSLTDKEAQDRIKKRDSFFQRFAMPAVSSDPAKSTVINPYWGQYGANFAWNLASLPQDAIESLGSEMSLEEEVAIKVEPIL